MGINTYNRPAVISKNNAVRDISDMAKKYFTLAEELRNNLKYKESVENYLHSILIDRNNPISYLGIALSYKNLKNYDKAIESLKKAEKLKPFDATIQKELAMCHIIPGDFDNGLKCLIRAISLEPKNVDIQMQLALVHEMIEEEQMALMIYQKIIETDPDYIRAYIQKATLYMHIEDYINSALLFRKVLKMKPHYYRAYLAIGICYEKLSNINAAKRYYKKYLKINPLANDYFDIKYRIREIKNRNQQKYGNLKLIYSKID